MDLVKLLVDLSNNTGGTDFSIYTWYILSGLVMGQSPFK